MKKTVLREYAKLIAVKGANVQKKQKVVIFADLDQPEFVKMVVEECYKAGASEVEVRWNYQPLEKLHIRNMSVKSLSTVNEWEIERMKQMVKDLPARIFIESEDPDGLIGINQSKLAKSLQAKRKAFKPLRDAMDNKHQWCIAAVPGKAWAKKLFPNERTSAAVEKLWEAILSCARANGDAVKNWDEHNADLAARCKYLNSLDLAKLEYKSKNGTDFTVGLIKGVNFLAGAEYTQSGVVYNPNMPSEEVFTSPDKNTAEGIVYSTKPLSYNGEVIDGFSIEFKNGKAVKVNAKKNQSLLEEIIRMDETACMLGECALVPYNSPINNSGILFYNTLFDENAACHLALGCGFDECVEGHFDKTKQECKDMGINDSIIHVDFMIGSDDMNITGITRDGKRVPVFKNGNWAF